MKKLMHHVLHKLGYKIVSIESADRRRQIKEQRAALRGSLRNDSGIIKSTIHGAVKYSYVKSDGSFDYEKYRAIQQKGNKIKLDYVAVIEDNIRFLSDYLEQSLSGIGFGLCHGTRRGKEQEWFRKYLGCDVIGTEISETAHQFPHTIRWDFHDTKDEWLNSVDFIYSNSLDHS